MILQGDVREKLKELDPESVQCVVTSPPYWGLRDYGVEGQIGLEATPEEYLDTLVTVFQEVRRVLRKDGTVFLNMGDSYTSTAQGTFNAPERIAGKGGRDGEAGKARAQYRPITGLKPKDLCGMPWRLALALQADGWWLRSDIIWAKPNPMPESVTDRPTRSHEYIFLLTRSKTYYYDAEAVREPVKPESLEREKYGWKEAFVGRHTTPGEKRPCSDDHTGFTNPNGRNLRSVWNIPTQPYPEAHFATFPESLVKRCILAGTSEKGRCPDCGAPWERVVDVSRTFESGSGKSGNMPDGKNGPDLQGGGETLDIRRGPVTHTQTLGWQPTCKCGKEPVPCVVLDPFGGSGTVGKVAQEIGRDWILIDLKPEYCEMANKRTRSQIGMQLP